MCGKKLLFITFLFIFLSSAFDKEILIEFLAASEQTLLTYLNLSVVAKYNAMALVIVLRLLPGDAALRTAEQCAQLRCGSTWRRCGRASGAATAQTVARRRFFFFFYSAQKLSLYWVWDLKLKWEKTT